MCHAIASAEHQKGDEGRSECYGAINSTGGQPSSDDITGALGIHNASNGEINAHTTSKVERRIAKDPRDTGDLVGIPIFTF